MKKIHVTLLILLAISSAGFASLLFHTNRNEIDLRRNPADREALEFYQGYETAGKEQTVTVLNYAAISNGTANIVRLSNYGWKPLSYQAATNTALFDESLWQEMPKDRIIDFTLPLVPGAYTINTLFLLHNEETSASVNSVI